MEQSLSWEATRCTPGQEIHFITPGGLNIFTRAIHLFTSWARWIHFMPSDSVYWRAILIVSTHLCLDFPRCFFVWAHRPKPVNFPLSYTHASWPIVSHIIPDFLTLIVLLRNTNYYAVFFIILSSCYFLILRIEHLTDHHVLKPPQSVLRCVIPVVCRITQNVVCTQYVVKHNLVLYGMLIY